MSGGRHAPAHVDSFRQGEAFGLATIVASDGGPRPIGSQMVITEREYWGISFGRLRRSRRRVAWPTGGRGRRAPTAGLRSSSPFIDMRLPCGVRLEVLIERVRADEPALACLAELTALRRPARWQSDGLHRRCGPADRLPSPTIRIAWTCSTSRRSDCSWSAPIPSPWRWPSRRASWAGSRSSSIRSDRKRRRH